QVTNTASEAFLSYFFSKSNSVAAPTRITHKRSTKVLHPKKYMETIIIGIRDTITVLIIFWGIKFFFINSDIKIPPPKVCLKINLFILIYSLDSLNKTVHQLLYLYKKLKPYLRKAFGFIIKNILL